MSNSPPSPPFLSRIWPALISALAVFGIPTATVAYFFTHHPLLALTTFLLYECGVFIIGFLGKVWGKLEDPFAEHVAAWLKHRVISIFSRYHRQYYQYLRYQHRDFDVKGLSILGTYTLELDQVFVELRVDPSTPQQASVNPVQIPQPLREGSHAIWDYLASPPLRQQHFVVIGPPGSGKTTLLKHIALALVVPRRLFHRRQHAQRAGKMPILLFLRDHAQAITEQQPYSLVNAIRDHLTKWEQPFPPEGWLERQLRKGGCLVMLDGLDEVADPETRQKVVNWVERQMAGWSRCRFLMTSRPFGYRSNPLTNVTVLEVRPFTLEQVEQFVHQWYLANEVMSKQKDDPGVRMQAQQEAKALLQRLRTTPALFELTVNPLLLTMIATVHRYGGELPGRRVALYAEICEVFLGKRQLARGQVLEFTPAQMQSVLEPLAYHMMNKGIRDIACSEAEHVIEEPLTWISTKTSPKVFLRTIEHVSGLLLERENGFYSFAHQTFQEYLAASYIREKQWGHSLVACVGEAWWRETILLYCAMVDATSIIAACLKREHTSVATLELVIDAGKEAKKVQPEVRSKLDALLQEGVEDPDAERRQVVAEALLMKRLRNMIYLKDETFVDTSLVTCAEYQIFLNEKYSQGQYLQPDHWTTSHFPTGQGNEPVLGARRTDAKAFCSWLTERELGPWRYRLPKEAELEREGLIRQLPPRTGYWLEGNKAFSWARNDQVLSDSILDAIVALLFTIDQTIDQTRVLANTLTYDLNHALDLNLVHDLSLNIELDLVRIGAIVNSRDLDRDDFRNKISSRNRDRDKHLSRIRDRIRGHAHAIASTIDLARNIVRDLDLGDTSSIDHALEHAHTHAQGLASNFVISDDLARNGGVVIDLTHILTTTYDRVLASALALNFACPIDLDRDFVGDLALSSTRQHDLDLAFNLAIVPIRDFAHAHARALAIAKCLELLREQQLPRESSPFLYHVKRKQQEEGENQHYIKTLHDIYCQLVILRKRIKGELPAYEGILILKEKK